MSEHEKTLRVAEAIRTHYAWNGRTFREGQFVAILDGKIVAVTDRPEDAIATLRAMDPDTEHGMVVPVKHPQVDIIR